MRFTRVLLPTAFSFALLATAPASAAITVSFRPNSITPAAIAADPVLANMQSWSIMVTTDGNWVSAGVEARLPVGNTFYNPPLGGNFKPNPALLTLFPQLAFDTYVTCPADNGTSGQPAILGFYPEAPGSGDFGGTSGRFSVSWGDLFVDPPGTYEIARLTFGNGLIPTVNPMSNTSQVNPDSTATFAVIPEPSVLGLVTLAGLLAVRRRRD